MKGTRKKYEVVAQLPKNAKRVRTYADEVGWTVAYIYKLYSQGKIKIVTFENINFVVA